MDSPSAVPPGSRQRITTWPCSSNHRQSSSTCVVFPVPSPPSIAMNISGYTNGKDCSRVTKKIWAACAADQQDAQMYEGSKE